MLFWGGVYYKIQLRCAIDKTEDGVVSSRPGQERQCGTRLCQPEKGEVHLIYTMVIQNYANSMHEAHSKELPHQ